MKIDDINYTYEEICFKIVNNLDVSFDEKEFFKCYCYLTYWYQEIEKKKENELKKILNDMEVFPNEK